MIGGVRRTEYVLDNNSHNIVSTLAAYSTIMAAVARRWRYTAGTRQLIVLYIYHKSQIINKYCYVHLNKTLKEFRTPLD